jgi:flagellar assembly factor FliW
MVTSTLQNERGRSVYERVCKLLNLTKSIPGFEQEKMMLIQQTYTHKPNLPALRDEMRQAGLVE